jgi:hypothetical protein
MPRNKGREAMKTITGVIAASLMLGLAADVNAAPERSCEAWQGASRQQLAGEETWQAALIVGDDVQVYAAPESVCGCPGTLLHKSMAVFAYRSFHGFTRILYLDRRSGVQISGWVRSGQLRHQAGTSLAISRL